MGTSLEIWEGQQSDGVLGAAQLVQPVMLAELVPVLLLVLGPAEWDSELLLSHHHRKTETHMTTWLRNLRRPETHIDHKRLRQ